MDGGQDGIGATLGIVLGPVAYYFVAGALMGPAPWWGLVAALLGPVADTESLGTPEDFEPRPRPEPPSSPSSTRSS